YTARDFAATQNEMQRQLHAAGAAIDGAWYCPHLPDAGCLCRKPGTALHREAIATWEIDPARSWCIGDQVRDIEPAIELGCRAMLVQSGQGRTHLPAAKALGAVVAADLRTGLPHLLDYTSRL
ncbi:MAG: HAD-IIIA family hydrolase, partial [Gemmatimonadales bacterium]